MNNNSSGTGQVSTPQRHDEHGPSRHPYLVACHAFKNKQSDGDGGGYPALRGTFLHDLYYKLSHGEIKDEEVYAFKKIPGTDFDFTYEDADAAIDAAVQREKAIEWFMRSTGACSYYDIAEQWVDLGHLGISGGSPDDVIIADMEYMMVLDAKFGMGEVSPWTEQLTSYSSGLIKDRPITRVFQGIIQPGLRDKPWIVEVPLVRIEKHVDMMRDVIASAKAPNPPRTPFAHCDWCGDYPCTAVKAMSRSAGSQMIRVEQSGIENVDDEQLQDLAVIARKLEKASKAVKGEIGRRLANGVELSRWVLRPGRSTRIWTDDSEAESALAEACALKKKPVSELYESKLISPAKADKLLGKSKAVTDLLSGVTMKKEGRLTPVERKEEK
jgi:hypothetical protein